MDQTACVGFKRVQTTQEGHGPRTVTVAGWDGDGSVISQTIRHPACPSPRLSHPLPPRDICPGNIPLLPLCPPAALTTPPSPLAGPTLGRRRPRPPFRAPLPRVISSCISLRAGIESHSRNILTMYVHTTWRRGRFECLPPGRLRTVLRFTVPCIVSGSLSRYEHVMIPAMP